MNTHKHRAEFLLTNTIELALFKIRKGYIITVQKRKSIVIILDVQRRTQALGLLVKKAENALVFTDVQAVEKVICKPNSEVFIVRFRNRELKRG